MIHARSIPLLLAGWLFFGGGATAWSQDWQPLFDGVSLSGWTHEDGQPVHTPAWEAADGMLHLDRSQGRGGNLLTDREFGDFELVFEWSVAPGANNGIKYRVGQFSGSTLGIEYQVIDDARHTRLSAKHKTASLYDIFPAREHHVLHPAGQFNRGRIVVKQEHIEHWLNGRLISAAVVGSSEWNDRLAESKFANVEGFGRNPSGKIMLTDHGDEVWYRNIFIRDLSHSLSSDDLALARRNQCCSSSVRRRGLFRR